MCLISLVLDILMKFLSWIEIRKTRVENKMFGLLKEKRIDSSISTRFSCLT